MIGEHRVRGVTLVFVALGVGALTARPLTGVARPVPWNQELMSARACFLLTEIGVGRVRAEPTDGCDVRVTPASTFKIPHALAALDAAVITGADERLTYPGTPMPFAAWKRDHTLATAMRYSVVWYFQEIADRLGPRREREYLERLDYGNADASGDPRGFWLGDSLEIAPIEQERFLMRLYRDDLPIEQSAMETVRELLVQPQDAIVNAAGEHPFAAPWPQGVVLGAKTGSASDESGDVRWLVGHARRSHREWVFVSCVTGRNLDSMAAVVLAARGLREARVL